MLLLFLVILSVDIVLTDFFSDSASFFTNGATKFSLIRLLYDIPNDKNPSSIITIKSLFFFIFFTLMINRIKKIWLHISSLHYQNPEEKETVLNCLFEDVQW